ncbi:MAG: 4'-phosphopantetheinyl transferase superfamily protein [Psychromonas sp.]|nr:4'-phosphopantetheinyl transferase superfamily protein [Psychromonas sp.]
MFNLKKLTLIGHDDIHIWTVEPKKLMNNDLLSTFHSILSLDERQKVDSYRFRSGKHNALITRVFLRFVLSQYATISPKDWCFSYSDLGKPEIANLNTGLRFNLSHNDSLIICAICLNKDIGCDVENLSRKISIAPIAKRFFSTKEANDIQNLPSSLQVKGFFERWTLKESFVKATGKGITQGLSSFRFELKTTAAKQYREDINLYTDNHNKRDNNWFSALLYPDEIHCIALTVNTSQKPKIILKENTHSMMLKLISLI